MTSAQQLSALSAAGCDVAFDNLTRQLYATDASIYQVEPMAVAFPRDAKQAKSIIKAATQAGNQLNDFLHPRGFCFGPDVATSSRATLGGMIANDSSGAHTPVHGTTADHVAGLELVLSGGQ